VKHKGLKRQGSLYVLAVLCVIAAGFIVPRLWPQIVQACTEYARAFAENFDAVNFKDAEHSAIARWPSGPINLPQLGANFVVSQPGGMGALIYTCASGDFTGDGYPDLIGFDVTGQEIPNQPQLSQLVLVRNLFLAKGKHPDFTVDKGTSYEKFYTLTAPCAMTAGDYNHDGRINKREVYVQEYDSTLEMLAQPIGSVLSIKSWREIYRVIW